MNNIDALNLCDKKVLNNAIPPAIENWFIDCNSAFKAYRKYVGNGYFENINNGLRKDLSLGFKEADIARKMDKIFDMMPNKYKVKTNETVYRGISIKNMPQELLDIITQKSSENTFVDKGFVSTSKKRSVGKEFMGSNGILLVIDLPKGTKRIDTNDVIFKHIFDNESEVTLPRNSKFRVDSYNKEARVAKLTYLGQEYPLPQIKEEKDKIEKDMDLLAEINKTQIKINKELYKKIN